MIGMMMHEVLRILRAVILARRHRIRIVIVRGPLRLMRLLRLAEAIQIVEAWAPVRLARKELVRVTVQLRHLRTGISAGRVVTEV